ncbi:MAG TPA: S1 RNA-binding domain-containing protein [Thermoanaerobaculia bacterium]|nr:S1 RNA-binding domain-containing protein [Thermoanaerobaculia bacterium]
MEPYGAFVEILPGQDGLLHISEMAHTRVGQVTDLFQLGDEVEVQVVGIEPDTGKIRLSRKPLLPPPTEEELAAAAASRESRGPRPPREGGDRGGFRGGDRDRGPRRDGGGGGHRDRDRGPRPPRREGGGGGGHREGGSGGGTGGGEGQS